METYEVTPELILGWANEQASFKELEQVAKALYSIYVQERKQNGIEVRKDSKVWYNRRKRAAK